IMAPSVRGRGGEGICMRVAEIRQENDLLQLRTTWDRLVCESAANTIFLTWEWVTAWWAAYGSPGDLRILVFSDEDGVPRGIAPMRRQVVERCGQKVAALAFVG